MDPEIVSLFMQRFPRYAFSILGWAPSPQTKKKTPLEDLPLDQTQILYLYGLSANAALQLIPWLSGNPARRLLFLEPDTGAIAAFLEEPSAKEILLQKQIELYHLPKKKAKKALIQELVQRYPIQTVFLSFCLGNKKEYARFKLQLMRNSANAFATHAESLKFSTALFNAKRNCVAAASSSYVLQMKDAFASIPALICGAGPSLQKALDVLRGLRQKALIIAGGSAIAALTSQGVEPHLAVAVDPTGEEFERLKNSFAFQTPLLFSLRLNPFCLAAGNGPLGYFPTHLSGPLAHWLEKEIPAPHIGSALPPESYSVTMLSAALAHHFGCNPILFEGIDLAYTNQRRYADGIDAKELTPRLRAFNSPLARQNKNGATVSSTMHWVMEANALSKFARRCKDRRWIQCSTDGLALKGVESMPLSEAAKLFSEERDLSGLVHQAFLSAPIPNAIPKHFADKLQELELGLDRMLGYLDPIVQNKPGLAVLAELELQEDLIYRELFQMIAFSIRRALLDPEDKPAYWNALRSLLQEAKRALRL